MHGSWRKLPHHLIFKFVMPLSHDLKLGSKDLFLEAEGRMARSQDDLIAFLIGKIASRGQQGASFPSSSRMRQICPIVPVGKSPACRPTNTTTICIANLPLSVSNHYLMPIPCPPEVSTINDLSHFS